MKGYKAKILVDSNATPKYMKVRSIPYYYREKVVKELNQLVEEGTLEPVEHSDWTSPIVAVLKPDKENVWICGDFKHTVNLVSKLDSTLFLVLRICSQNWLVASRSRWTLAKPTCKFP